MKFPTGGKVHELFLLNKDRNNMNWCNSSTDSYSLDGRSEIVGCLKLVFDLIVFYMQYFKIILIHSALIKLYYISSTF